MRKSEEEENREFWGSKQTLQKFPPGFLRGPGMQDLEFGSGIALDPFWAPFLAWVGKALPSSHGRTSLFGSPFAWKKKFF